ncbi:hypothetical protein J1614_000129, partial [Plenodomus biglobosus]
MAPTLGTPYNPSESNAPSSTLPEHMHGLIDLATLTDMNRFLSESLSQDDLTLAGWIRDNFLYEPLEQTSRPIRTPEGFSKLDHAYRRVRSLTNKVQDKWPFFDQNFKVMPATTVRNNSRGEISPGVIFQQKHGSAPPANGVTATNASHKLDFPVELPVPFDAHQLGRHCSQSKDHFQSSEHAHAPLPSKLLASPKSSPNEDVQINPSKSTRSAKCTPVGSTSSVGPSQFTDQFSVSTRPTAPQPELVIDGEDQTTCDMSQNATATETSNKKEPDMKDLRAASIHPTLTSLHETDGGKLRGMNGRFQPKLTSSPRSDRATQRRAAKVNPDKSHQKCKYTQIYKESSVSPGTSTDVLPANSKAAKEVAAEMTEPTISVSTNSNNSVANVRSPSTPLGGDYVDTTEATELIVPDLSSAVHDEETAKFKIQASKPRVRFSDIIPEDPSPSYKFAAESDPVVSNLDRRPSNSLKRALKRRSPASYQSKSCKRGRSSKLAEASAATDSHILNGTNVTQGEASVEKIGVTTRRSARRSAAARTDLTETIVQQSKSTNDKPLKDVEESKFDDEDATMVDVDAQHTTIVEEKLVPVSIPKANQPQPKVVPRATSPRVTGSPTSTLGMDPATQSFSDSTRDHLLDLAMSQMDKADFALSQRSLMPSVVSKAGEVKKSGLKKSIMPRMSPKHESFNGSTQQLEACSKGFPPHNQTSHQTNNTPAPPLANDLQQTVATQPKIGNIEYFARVHTTTGFIDVPMSADKIKNEEGKLLQKYAVFVSKRGTAAIDFDMYREIYVSTK